MPSTLSYQVKPGGLSASDHERIHELAARGWKSSRIAREIEKHPGTVQWFMYRTGLKAPEYGRTKSSFRNGREIKPFTPEEDAFITALRLQNYGPTKIADMATKRFGHPRSNHTVACRLVMLAAREDA
ncbi:hypothetical protein [Mesorhizobium sp.]|uniref:hypothetical protein n=1 Tax=Mesorhizobium sp. TaxID=1871066 RepID=UPI0011FA79DD|nr:hypothetical protein [Mesorhizobium sp.]TIL34270.1 MAG: hypothetical protein E5Y85_11045 [Mesorhizobium sp.]TIM09182.1 MAG: hypothetical protein E5Y62_13580 [Mesorhizobium sp.]